MAASDFPFTHDTVVVHKAFRREFGQASTLVRRVASGDTKQAGVLHSHLGMLFDQLHHHHEAEDVELWPRLRQRATGQQELLDRMEVQHSGIDPARVATADATARDALADCLDELVGPLLAHLDQEEAEILPLVQEHLTQQEWALLGEYAVAHTPKSDLLKGIGGLLEDATPAERDLMLGHLPAVPKLLYKAYGRRAYIKDAHGGPRSRPSGPVTPRPLTSRAK